MNYTPLIWAGLWRKPVRTALTLMSIVVAFVLFGLTLGFDASVHRAIDIARLDVVYVDARFGQPQQISQREQLRKIPGVTAVGAFGVVNGYFRDPKNTASVLLIDDEMPRVWPEPLSPGQFAQLRDHPSGVFVTQVIAQTLNLHAGDPFPVIAPKEGRADGSTVWPFEVLGIVPDRPTDPGGLIFGNYAYLDQNRPEKERGRVTSFELLVDPPSQAHAVAMAVDETFQSSSTPTRSIPEKSFYESETLSGIDVTDIGFLTKATAGAGLFMIFFLIGNVTTQSVRERVSEFCVLKAIGFSDVVITMIILVEATVLALAGAVFGLFIALILIPAWTSFVPASWELPAPQVSVVLLAMATAIAIGIACVCAFFPILRTRRADLAAALGNQL